jgi:hypothetical protein
MDESISSRDQQLQQNEPFDPLYQNIIPEINQMPLIFVPGKYISHPKKELFIRHLFLFCQDLRFSKF